MATRVAVVPAHRPSRGAPRRTHAAQQLLPTGAGWSLSVAGFPLSSTGICGGRESGPEVRLESRGCPEPVHYGPVEPGTCLDRWCDGLGTAQGQGGLHPPAPKYSPKTESSEPTCSDSGLQAGPVSSGISEEHISELHRQDTGRDGHPSGCETTTSLCRLPPGDTWHLGRDEG